MNPLSAPLPLSPCLLVSLSLLLGAPARAQRIEPAPKDLEKVGVTEHLGAQIPLDLTFIDSDGKQRRLGDFFDGTRPVILTLNYSDCPMLCSLQLNGLLDTLEKMSWTIGQQFQIVTISINPLETPQRAALTKQKYLKLYGRPGSDGGWHFLTSRQEAAIKRVADAVGFGYVYVADQKQYAHPAVLMICTPDGKVSRYLGGIEYDPQTLRLSLVEASAGKVGSAMDTVLLYCFHYDSSKGRYGPAAMNLMRAGSLLTVTVVGGLLIVLWRRERGQRSEQTRGEQARPLHEDHH